MTAAARTDDRSAQTAELGAGTAYTLLAALGFAATSTLTSIATRAGVDLFTVQTWRYVLASVVLASFVVIRGYPRMPPREMTKFLVIGGIGQATFVGMALSSLKFIPVATLAFLFYTYPMWVALVQAVRGAEPLTARRAVALALSFGGIAVIAGAPSDRIPWQGFALAIGAAVVYGGFIPTMQVLQKNHPVPVTSAYSKIGTAVCFLLLSVATGSFSYELPATAWQAIGALTILSTVLPSLFFLMGLIRLGAVRTAIVSTVEPFLTAVLGAVVLGQGVSLAVLAGGGMIVAAVLVLRVRRERVA